MPSDIRIESDPPAVALLQDSGAITPSVTPVPKRSGVREARLA
jgi:hypothetical protein